MCTWVQVIGVYVGDGWVITHHLHSGSFRELAEELQGEKDEARILPYLRLYLYFGASKASKVRRESGHLPVPPKHIRDRRKEDSALHFLFC